MTPLPFPDVAAEAARVRLEIDRVDYAAPEASGRQGGVQAGWPLWLATFDIERSHPDSGDQWHTFLDRLRGRIRTFLVGDPTRNFPKAAPMGFAGMVRGGGGAFDGSALAWSQAFDADGNALLGLTGLPAGFQLSQRDLIGFKWDAAGAPANSHHRRTLARVVVPATANGAGAVTVMVEPPIDTTVVPVGAIAHFDNPRCVMRQVPEKTGVGPIGAGGSMGGGTLVAVQDLRA